MNTEAPDDDGANSRDDFFVGAGLLPIGRRRLGEHCRWRLNRLVGRFIRRRIIGFSRRASADQRQSRATMRTILRKVLILSSALGTKNWHDVLIPVKKIDGQAQVRADKTSASETVRFPTFRLPAARYSLFGYRLPRALKPTPRIIMIT